MEDNDDEKKKTQINVDRQCEKLIDLLYLHMVTFIRH